MLRDRVILAPEKHDQATMSDAFQQLVDVVSDDEPVAPEEGIFRQTTSRRRFDLHLRYLLSKISTHWACACTSPHKAGLLLSSQRAQREAINEANPCSFTLFLNRADPKTSWQETQVLIPESIEKMEQHLRLPHGPTRSVKFQVPEPTVIHGKCIKSLCKETSVARCRKMRLVVDGHSLRDISPLEHDERRIDGEYISIERGYLIQEMPLDLKYRISLAVTLSFSLLDLSDDSWLPGGWNRESIMVFQSQDGISLRPSLVTTAGPAHGSIAHAERKLLSHGILLMEVFEQARMPFSTRLIDTDLSAVRNLAREAFGRIEWNEAENFKLGVELCIESGSSLQKTDAVDKYHETLSEVIRLLDTDHMAAWNSKEADSDSVLTSFTLPRVPLDPDLEEMLVHPMLSNVSRSLDDTVGLSVSTLPLEWHGREVFDIEDSSSRNA